MKTKIIYISGSEIFDVADIRSAFDEVRSALNLDADTVLFGVPVDSDDAGLSTGPDTETVHIVADPIIIDQVEPPLIGDPEYTPMADEPAPVKKTRKTRTKAKAQEPVIVEEKNEEPVVSEPIVQPEPEQSEKIIPILSILSGKSEDTDATDMTQEPVVAVVDKPSFDTVSTDESEVIKIETATAQKVTVQAPDSDMDRVITTKSVTIEEIITDEVPSKTSEKTLEQLLESMAPLREDIEKEPAHDDAITEPVATMDEPESDVDATLAKLATEFAETEDDLPEPKAENTGKIGKLKNILPFKKAKREEPGLMGDLFGWAGIAANDDEFSIPGFFTGTGSKK